MFHRQKSYRIHATPERSSALPLCHRCDDVMQRGTPFLMFPCRQLSDTTTQLPICSTPRPADPTPHVGLPLVPVGTQSTRTPNPAQEIPALPEPQWNPHVLAPKPLSDTFSGVWPTPLAKAHYGRADFSTRSWCLGGITGLDVQTKFWMRGVHHTPKRLGQTLAMLSSPLSPPPLLSHPRIIIFGWITWELFADVVMI